MNGQEGTGEIRFWVVALTVKKGDRRGSARAAATRLTPWALRPLAFRGVPTPRLRSTAYCQEVCSTTGGLGGPHRGVHPALRAFGGVSRGKAPLNRGGTAATVFQSTRNANMRQRGYPLEGGPVFTVPSSQF
ncbi:hypothetical protein SKAU_G00049980 [Synaphobranchus kaupii]|uniref:Uncharacterized protein n=1 Tax=Synaphobranchus kaupii TaxID=118154 RepID=A0A9Q1J9C0_SYNKA|nr:hypothetical protein SKAU_G00049980 [Synaphobranchus kaupii]